jgi:hypothetical protein
VIGPGRKNAAMENLRHSQVNLTAVHFFGAIVPVIIKVLVGLDSWLSDGVLGLFVFEIGPTENALGARPKSRQLELLSPAIALVFTSRRVTAAPPAALAVRYSSARGSTPTARTSLTVRTSLNVYAPDISYVYP